MPATAQLGQKAPTVAGSISGRSLAPGKQEQGQNATQSAGGTWSLLGKMYSSQMLAYMVAIHDAKAMMDRMRHMRPGPSLHLPLEVQGMNIWQVLQGCVQQPRPATVGKQQQQPAGSSLAGLPDAAAEGSLGSKPCSPGLPGQLGSTARGGQHQLYDLQNTATAAADPAALTGAATGSAAHGHTEQGKNSASSASNRHTFCSQQPVMIALRVLPTGHVQLLISCSAAEGNTARHAGETGETALPHSETPQSVVQKQPPFYTPTTDEVQAAVLAILQAYIRTYLSRFSLQAFLEKQQQAARGQSVADGADWEGGSIAASAVTKRTKFKAPKSIAGVAIGAGPVSYAMSSTSNTIKAALAARRSTAEQSSSNDGSAAGDKSARSNVDARPGAAVAAVAAVAADPPSPAVANTSNPGSKGGYAQSVVGGGYARSVIGGYAASVWGGASAMLGWEGAGEEPGAAAGPDELKLHGALLLCREVGLIDNITEHLDVIRCFELMLHRKRGRLGPAAGRPGTASNVAGAVKSNATIDVAVCTGGCAAVEQQQTPGLRGVQEAKHTARGNSGTYTALGVGMQSDSTTTNTIRVVHVVRPGVPAAALHVGDSDGSGAPGRPGTGTASRVLNVDSLNAAEVLELLILVMKERHPCYRREPELLLRMLAAWHIALLQFRRPDRGLPWLLRQVLQPELLQAIESPATTELLHGIYVHLAGSSGSPQDLSMNLSDIRLGLKHAAGFRSQHDMQQLQMQTSQAQKQQVGQSSSKHTAHGYEASTHSSRGRATGPGLYVRMDSASMRQAADENSSSISRRFQVPLYKVAEFLRTAKLLPRLFDKYVTQLQRQGEAQKVKFAVRGLPIMPCLKAQVHGNTGLGHERRSPGYGAVRRRSALRSANTGMHRLATLQECGSSTNIGLDSCDLPQQGVTFQPSQQRLSFKDGSLEDQHSIASFLDHSVSAAVAAARGLEKAPWEKPGGSCRAHSFVAFEDQTSPHARVFNDSCDGASVSSNALGNRSSRVLRQDPSNATIGSSDTPGTPHSAGAVEAAVTSDRAWPGVIPPSPGSAGAPFTASYRASARYNSAPPLHTSQHRRVSGDHEFTSTDGSKGAVSIQQLSRCSSQLTALGGLSTGLANVGNDAKARAMNDGQLDAAMLDVVELVPLRSKAATIIIGASSQEHAYSSTMAKHYRNTGASQNLLQLPSPATYITKKGNASGACTGATNDVHKFGDDAWQQLLKSEKGGKKQVPGGKATYEQQQEVLKQQELAAEADAALAQELEVARQDTWTVFVLVELLGSHIVTPGWSCPVPLSTGQDVNQNTASHASSEAGGSTGVNCNVQAASMYCSWSGGYAFTSAEELVARLGPNGDVTSRQSVHNPTSSNLLCGAACGSSFGTRSAVPCDFMNYCITYPQFVEILLCLMAERSITLLEPDVKQLRNLTMDEEMQDHANVVLERIKKWRVTQLTPWKAKGQAGSDAVAAAVNGGSTNGSAAATASNNGSKEDKGKPVIPGLVARVYSVYSNMEPGSSCLGLHKSGFIRLLTDANVIGGSDATVADAAETFSSLLASTAAIGPPASQNCASAVAAKTADVAVQPSTAAQPVADSARASIRSPFGTEQRQSTFMRSVTHQLMERLQASSHCGATLSAAGVNVSAVDVDKQQIAQQYLQQTCEAFHKDDEPGMLDGCMAVQQWETVLQQCSSVEISASADIFDDATEQALAACAKENNLEQMSAVRDVRSAAETADSISTTPCAPSNNGSNSSNAGSGIAASAATTSVKATDNTNSSNLISRSSSTSASTNSSRTSQASTESASLDAATAAPYDTCPGAVLTLQQFQQALVILTRKAYPRIANATRAWKLMIDRHIQPLADKKRNRFDAYQGSLGTPGATALLTAWQAQLSQLFEAAVATQNMQLQQRRQQSQQGGLQQLKLGSHCSNLLLSSFMEFLQDRSAIPQLLEPTDVQEALKRLIAQQPDPAQVFSSLDHGSFVQALAICGLAVFAARRLQSSPLKQPEQQLTAFLSYLGLSPLPGQKQLLADTTGQQSTAQEPTSFKSRMLQQLNSDPYKEWWSIEFDPAAENKAHDHLSSLTYMPVMLQEAVLPPASCPAEVLPLLSAAQSAHQARQVDDAMALYGLAEEAWRDLLAVQQQAQQQRWDWEQAACEPDVLPAAVVLYLSAAVSSCLLTGGREEQAWDVLNSCQGVLGDLHEAGADAALWHAAAGVALYHCEDLQAAFEHCVRSYVIRCECAPLGPKHPDTAAAGHNLGVVLDCLGKSSRGLELVEAAQEIFSSTLGPEHPRTLAAARNAQHIKHKLIKLPAKPQELLQRSNAAAETAASSNKRAAARRGSSAHSKIGNKAAGSKGSSGRTGSKNQQQKGSKPRNGVGSLSTESSSGLAGSSSDSSNDSDKKDKKKQADAKKQSTSKRNMQRHGSMQERLNAVMNSRQQQDGASGNKAPNMKERREYTDLNHLGAGVFRASTEQRALYEAVKPDIAAHARAARCATWSDSGGPGVVEMQVLPPGHYSGSTVLPVLPARSASASPVMGNYRDQSQLQQPGTMGCSSAQAVPLPQLQPVAAVPAKSGLLVRRGQILDATIAAVKKPLSVEQARRLRRQQMQQRGKPREHNSLVDRLYRATS